MSDRESIEGLVLFSGNNCAYCEQLKEQLEKNEIEHKVINVSKEENEFYKFRYNIRSVPYVGYMVEGDKLSWSLLGNRANVVSIKEKLNS